MSDNTVEVKFGADASGVEKGAAEAARAVQGSVAQMKEAFAGVEAAVKSMHSQVETAFSGMQAIVAKFNNIMFALQNAMQGGAMFKEFINAAIDTTKESVGMAKALGITATEASYLKVALTAAGVSGDTLMAAANRITQTLVRNEKAFTDLGVATRDADGHLLNTRTVLEATNARLLEFREGTDRNVEGIKIYGRAWADIAPLVSKFKGETEETRKEAEDLNLVIGVEAVGAMVDYNKATRGANEVMEGIKNTIGQALMPQVTALSNWFRSIGPQAIDVTRIAMNGYLAVQATVKESVLALWNALSDAFHAIGSVINGVFGEGGDGVTALEFFANVIHIIQVAFIDLRVGIETAVNVIRGALEAVANVAHLAGAVIGAAINLDWAGVKEAWAQFKVDTVKTISDTMDKAVEIARKGREDIDAAIMGDLTAHQKPTAIAQKEGGDRSDGGKDPKDAKAKSELGELKETLRQKLEVTGAYFKDSTDQEIQYWQHIADTRKLSVEDGRAVQSILFNLTKKRLQDEHAEQEAQVDADLALSKARIATKVAEIGALKQAGVLSDVEALTRIKALHAAEAAEDQAAMTTKLALYGTEAKERIKLLGDIQVAQQKADAVALKDAAAVAAAVQKSWTDAFAPIVSAFDSSVKGVIAGTTTLHKALTNMLSSIATEAVNAGVKMVANWAATEAAKTGATAAGTATRMALEGAAAVQSVAMGAWAAVKNIMNYAWEAMAGAYKAIVGIPYVGPFLAPAAAGVAFAGVAAAVTSIASASGGYDIPQGVNPLTQLHAEEMVLPKQTADTVRNAMEGGGAGGGTVHIHGSPDDSIKLRDLPAILTKLNRDFKFVR